MRLHSTEKLLKRLTAINDLLLMCKQRIETAIFNYNSQFTLPKRDQFLYYPESHFLACIRRYEHLYIWLEKRFNKTMEKL